MTADIRIATDLHRHPKTLKMIRRLGERSFRALIALWGWAGTNREDGDLSGMDTEDIALAADWMDAPANFTAVLAEVGFLDGEPGAYTLHDWIESQPWIAERAARQQRARDLVAIRWAKRRASETDTVRNTARNTPRTKNGYGAQYSQPNPTQPNQDQGTNVPLSNPPVGVDSTVAGSQPVEPVETPQAAEREPRDTPTRRIFDHWRETMKHPGARLDEKRTRAIRHALQLGYTEERIRQAITGCSLTPHNMGDNDRGQRYDGLELILRNADQIDRFIGNATNPPKPKPRSASGRRHDPDDQTRDRYGVKYGSIILAEELGLIPGGANDGQS